MSATKDKILALKQQIKQLKLKQKSIPSSKKHSHKKPKKISKKKTYPKPPMSLTHSDSDNSNSDSDISDFKGFDSDSDSDSDNETSKGGKSHSSFPKFDGTYTDDKGNETTCAEGQLKAETWLSKLEILLIDKNVPKSSWVRKAVVSFEGRAYKWAQRKLGNNPNYMKISWKAFLHDFKTEFCPVVDNDMHALDFKIYTYKMTPGMKVTTYSDQFKDYLEELDREESPKNQISRYLLGLTPELKKMVSQQKPHTLNAAIHYAEESQDILKDIEKPKPADPWINHIQHPTPNQDSYYQPYYQPYNQPYYYN